MNWNAISAISQLGILIIVLLPIINPSIDNKYSGILAIVFLLLMGFYLIHKFFRLIRKKPNGTRVYIVKWGVKHWIENPESLRKLGHSPDEVEEVGENIFHLYPTGKSINLK